jgi:hypothetical protein
MLCSSVPELGKRTNSSHDQGPVSDAARWPIQLMLYCGRSGRTDWIGPYQERSPSEDCCSPGITIRTTPAKRHIVTRGGQLRSASSALGMPSVVLDFAMSCRCQAVGNPLQPGGVMRVVHLHLVGNENILRLPDDRVNALRRPCLRPLWALWSRRENEPTNVSPSRFGSQLAKERRSLTRQNYSLTWVEIRQLLRSRSLKSETQAARIAGDFLAPRRQPFSFSR